MGFYLRKSVRVGPIRFNLSKSGIGMSAGMKGLRLGTGPRGNYVHMGRGGLYYRATLPSGQGASRHTSAFPTRPAPLPDASESPLTPIGTADVTQMLDASAAELLAELNAKQQRWALAPFVFLAFLVLWSSAAGLGLRDGLESLLLSGLLLVWAIGTWMAHRHDVLARTTVLMYHLEDGASQHFQELHDAFAQLNQCEGRWRIDARAGTGDWKHRAGANALVRRTPISFGAEPPRLVKTNIAVPSIPLQEQTLCFFPDHILVFSKRGVGAIAYSDIHVDIVEQRFVESERVPKDARVVGQTWRYPNKKGGPDKRFKNNRQIPVVLYEEILLSSSSGLNALLQVSRIGVGDSFRKAVHGLQLQVLSV